MCSPIIIEIWQQDIGNIDLINRDHFTFEPRKNYLFPSKYSGSFDINSNTKTKTSEKIIYDTSDIRNISQESKLFLIIDPLSRDLISGNSVPSNQESNQLLYRTYHRHEINSPCYPNTDNEKWNNTTKSIYGSNDIDTRNQSIASSL